MITRDIRGRITGTIRDWYPNQDEDDNWKDMKLDSDEILFPRHDENKVYPVRTYNIYNGDGKYEEA